MADKMDLNSDDRYDFTFDPKLAEGKSHERTAAKVILEHKCTTILVEHKFDELARTTGNVFVEFKQRGRPSGLSTTQSTIHMFEIAYLQWVIVGTPKLKA